MYGINKVTLVGHLGADPDQRTTTTGLLVVNISLATSELYKDRTTGEKKQHTEWHRIVFFGKRAEIVRDYTRKGSAIYIEGRLRIRKWQDKVGTDRWTTEIIGNEIRPLDRKPPEPQQPQTAPPPQADIPFDDDIPF